MAGLSDCGPQDVEHADVGPLPGDAPEALIEGVGVEARKFAHAADAQPSEITQHGGSDGDEIS